MRRAWMTGAAAAVLTGCLIFWKAPLVTESCPDLQELDGEWTDLGSAVGEDLAVRSNSEVDGTLVSLEVDGCTLGFGHGYTWTAPEAGDYLFSTVGSGWDTVLVAVVEQEGTPTSCTCNDDRPDTGVGDSLASEMVLTLEQGDVVKVYVGGFYDSEGTYRLSIVRELPDTGDTG